MPSSGQLLLTDPAADAHIPQHTRALHRAGLPARIDHLGFFQPDGFLRRGAHLLAHDTRHSTRPRQAAVPVDAGFTDHRQAFFLQRQQRDGAAWAHLPTGSTAIIAIPHAWHHQRRPDACQPGFDKEPAARRWWGRFSCTASSAGRWIGTAFSSVTPGGRMRHGLSCCRRRSVPSSSTPASTGRQCSQCLPPGKVEFLLGSRFQR